MDPMQYILERVIDGNHQGLLMLFTAGYGLHRWWLSVRPSIEKSAERVLTVLETIALGGLSVNVKHEVKTGSTGGSSALPCLLFQGGVGTPNLELVH